MLISIIYAFSEFPSQYITSEKGLYAKLNYAECGCEFIGEAKVDISLDAFSRKMAESDRKMTLLITV